MKSLRRLLFAFSIFWPGLAPMDAAPTTSAFTYQGRLTDGAAPASGSYDFRFILYDAVENGKLLGPLLTVENVTVLGGVFTVTLDFGPVFDGSPRWIQVSVRPGALVGEFTLLKPRQPLTAAPYALYALTPTGPAGPQGPPGIQGVAGAAGPVGPPGPGGLTGATGLTGAKGVNWRGAWGAGTAYAIGDAVSQSGASWLAKKASTGSAPVAGSADWDLLADKGATGAAGAPGAAGPQGIPGVAGTAGTTGAQGPPGAQGIQGIPGPPGSSDGWSRTGNAGINPATQFLGTTDGQPLIVRANNKRVMQFSERANAGNTLRAVNVLGGSEVNLIGADVVGATIAGGGQKNAAGPNIPNEIDGDFGSIGGGTGNVIDVFNFGTIGGGAGNVLQAAYGVIGGGSGNNAQADYSLIGGGDSNYSFGKYSAIGGGHMNQVTADFGTVGGGGGNMISAVGAFIGGGSKNAVNGIYGAIGGGANNVISDQYGTVAGGIGNVAGVVAFVGGGQVNKATGYYAAIGGGRSNSVTTGSGTIAGGNANTTTADGTTIGGGELNYAGASWATVGGGHQNWAAGIHAVVGGGYLNQASAVYAIVPGGYNNYAGGAASFAAGFRAVASYDGDFVWADNSVDQDFAATAADQFCIRAKGGIVIESFGDVAIFTGVGTTDPGRYVELLNSPRAQSASGLKAGGVLVADSYGYANPGKNDLVVKGTLAVGYPNPAPYTFAVNGNTYSLNGYLSSDARYKTNIYTLEKALDRVLSLRGVNFDWRTNEFKDLKFPLDRQIGFIAQEIESVLPEVVITDPRGYKSVAYTGVIPVLVEAVKEQHAQLLAHHQRTEEQLAALEAASRAKDARIDALERSVAELKALFAERAVAKVGAR